MADNAPFYVGSTEDHDILIHPDNAVSLQPKGFAEKNGIAAHPDGSGALQKVAPKLHKSLGSGFQGTERDITVTQTSEPGSLSLRAGNAIRDAADAAGRGLGRVSEYVRGEQQPTPPPPYQAAKFVQGAPGSKDLLTGDLRMVNLPKGYEYMGKGSGREPRMSGAGDIDLGDPRSTTLEAGNTYVNLPPGYESMGRGSGVESGGGGAGGASGSGTGGAPGEEPNRYPNIAVGTPYERGVASAPQGSYYDLAHPPKSSSGGSGGSSGGSSGGNTSGGGAEAGAARGAEDVAAMRRAMSEGNPNGLTSTTEDSEASLGNSGKPSPETPVTEKAKPQLIGTTPSGEEVILTADNTPLVMQKGTAAAYGYSAHPDAPAVAEKLGPKLRSQVTPVGQPQVSVKQTSEPERNDPQWEQWYRARRAKHQQRDINKSLKAEPGVVLPDTTKPEPLDPSTAGGAPAPRPVVSTGPGENDPGRRVNAAYGPGSQREQPLEDVREVKPPQMTDAERQVQQDVAARKMQLQNEARLSDKGQPLPAEPTTEQSQPGAASEVANIARSGVKAAVNAALPGGVSDAVNATLEGASKPPDGGVAPQTMDAAKQYADKIQRKAYGAEGLPDIMGIGPNPGDRAFENGKFYIRDLDGQVRVAIGSEPPKQGQPGAGAAPGQKVKPVIPVGAASAQGAPAPAPGTQAPAPGQSGASVSSARMFIPGVKGDAAPTSETKAQEVERRQKGMADREEQIAQMQSRADQDLANTKERQSQDIARLDNQEMEIRRKANEDAEKMLADLKAKAEDIYNTKTDPYRAFRHTDTGQKIALVAGAFLNGFANAVNPGRNGKDAFEQIMDNDIQAQAKDMKNKESGLNRLMDVFKNHGTLAQNKILAATMLKSKYLEEAARTVEIMGLRSGDPIKIEMAKNKADELRNKAVVSGLEAQEHALKITHGNQQTQLNYQAIQKNKMDLDLQQTILDQTKNGGGMMAGWPSREFYGHTVVIPPSVARDLKELNKLYDSAQKIFAAHNATRTVADQALKYLADNKNWGTNGPNTALELKKMASRVAEVQRQNLGQTSVPTSELFGVIEEVLGKGNGFTPGNFDRVVRAWQDVAQQSDLDADSFFTVNRMGKLSTLRATRKDLQYGNTPTAAPAPGN